MREVRFHPQALLRQPFAFAAYTRDPTCVPRPCCASSLGLALQVIVFHHAGYRSATTRSTLSHLCLRPMMLLHSRYVPAGKRLPEGSSNIYEWVYALQTRTATWSADEFAELRGAFERAGVPTCDTEQQCIDGMLL